MAEGQQECWLLDHAIMSGSLPLLRLVLRTLPDAVANRDSNPELDRRLHKAGSRASVLRVAWALAGLSTHPLDEQVRCHQLGCTELHGMPNSLNTPPHPGMLPCALGVPRCPTGMAFLQPSLRCATSPLPLSRRPCHVLRAQAHAHLHT